MQLQVRIVHIGQVLIVYIVHDCASGMPRRGGLAALFQSREDAQLQDASREAEVQASGIPYTLLKTGDIADVPGGSSNLKLARLESSSVGTGNGTAGAAAISREDLAAALAGCITYVETSSAAAGLLLSVAQVGPGRPPAGWKEVINDLA
jgi:hypothetical protein